MSAHAALKPMEDYRQPYRDKLWCARQSGEVDEPEGIFDKEESRCKEE